MNCFRSWKNVQAIKIWIFNGCYRLRGRVIRFPYRKEIKFSSAQERRLADLSNLICTNRVCIRVIRICILYIPFVPTCTTWGMILILILRVLDGMGVALQQSFQEI